MLDNHSPEALEAALRIYAGKAVINSVTAEKKSREILFPLAKKYGAAVVLLAMDEDGILGVEDLARFLKEKKPVNGEALEVADAAAPCSLGTDVRRCPILKDKELSKVLREAERLAIEAACRESEDWQAVIKALGMSKSRFYAKKKEYGIP